MNLLHNPWQLEKFRIMIVRKYLNPKLTFLYVWKSLAYYIVLSVIVYFVSIHLDASRIYLPVYTIAILSTALAIFLGFNNNQAYDRWWEARKIWGLMVNYSRAWGRQTSTFFDFDEDEEIMVKSFQKKLVYRHAAFVHALRVFLRNHHDYNKNRFEHIVEKNDYGDLAHLIDEKELKAFLKKDNPPNYLIQLQGEDLKYASDKGWLNDFRYMQLDLSLVEFNNIQGKAERIKNTPMPRPYSYFSRVFVFIHATLLPFALVEDLGFYMIPVSVIISFVFKALDIIGERTQDPFENKMEDTPMSALSWTIERNLKEQLGEPTLPKKHPISKGVVF